MVMCEPIYNWQASLIGLAVCEILIFRVSDTLAHIASPLRYRLKETSASRRARRRYINSLPNGRRPASSWNAEERPRAAVWTNDRFRPAAALDSLPTSSVADARSVYGTPSAMNERPKSASDASALTSGIGLLMVRTVAGLRAV